MTHPTETSNKKEAPLLIKLQGKWVNVEIWKKVHPGGGMPLERFRGKDATDAFTSVHSQEALQMVDKMKGVNTPDLLEPATPATLAFRTFRAKLEKEGCFDRVWIWDAFYISVISILVIIGSLISYTYPTVAICLIGLGMQQAGWIGHDYVHGRGKVSYILGRLVGGLWNGFSSEWWSSKHNKHHVHTNQVGVDDDIANDPILHLYIPSHDNDFPFRAYQHLYYHLVYAFLYVSWRIQSFQYAWANGYKMELFLMLLNYTWLLILPWKVSIGSVILGGWLVAEIVTATHQSEDMFPEASFNFVEDQFATTRDVHMNSIFLNWLWGGMQFQLIHHLFPTMPKYKYGGMVNRIQQFAKENGLEYRASGMIDILKMNYDTMKRYAAVKN